jgi:uncharacterized protein YaiE (UPF0345 family)
MKKIGLMMVAVMFTAALAVAQETKYATGDDDGVGTNVAHVTFGPKNARQTISYLHAVCDKLDGAVKFYVRAAKYAVTGTNSPTVIVMANTAQAVSNNDIVVYSYANGAFDQRTVSSSSSTSITVNAALSGAYASGAYVYEVTQAGQLLVGRSGTAQFTNDTITCSGDVFAVPGDSPCYIQVNGTSNALIQATIK